MTSARERGAPWTAPGNLLIADSVNNRIRLVAAGTGTYYGHADDRRPYIYTVAGMQDRLPAWRRRVGLRADRPARRDAVDSSGNLLVAEQGLATVATDRRVRVVAASNGTFYGQQMTAGDIYTVAGNGDFGLLRRWWPCHQSNHQPGQAWRSMAWATW